MEANDSTISVFNKTCDLKSLIKEPMCNGGRFVWFPQDESHCYEGIL